MLQIITGTRAGLPAHPHATVLYILQCCVTRVLLRMLLLLVLLLILECVVVRRRVALITFHSSLTSGNTHRRPAWNIAESADPNHPVVQARAM